jgi:UDP-glucuronate decarboxylase
MKSVTEIVRADLEDIGRALEVELTRLAGKQVLITGGGGFLGYYLVQALLHHNRAGAGAAISVTVYDNFARGTPAWLEALAGDANLRLVRHDVTHPPPSDMPDFDFIIHAASLRNDGCPCERPQVREPLPIDSTLNNHLGSAMLTQCPKADSFKSFDVY